MLGRLVVIAGLLLAAAGAAPAAAAPPPSTDGKTYVALGDSYAAGFGLPLPSTPTGKPVPGCAQTTGDYPHLLAAKLGLKLTDVTCSGAVTDDFTAPQTVTGGTAPAQLDVFKTVQPDLVTVTIGGNDLGFSSIAQSCIATAGSGGNARVVGSRQAPFQFDTCKEYFDSTAAGGGKADNPYDKLPAVLAKVKTAIAAAQRSAPEAKVAVIAYPAIAPDAANTPAGGCFTSLALPPGLPVASALPFTDADVPYLQVLQQRLDDGIGRVADQLGVSYADIYPDSLAHSACQPESNRWVEPLVPGGGGTNVLHPTLAGTTAMADALDPVVRALFVAPPSPSTSESSDASTNGSQGPSSAAPRAGGAAPIADTGPEFPVGRTSLVGALLVVTGAALVLHSRRRRYSARH